MSPPAMNNDVLESIIRELARLVGQPLVGVWQPERDRVVVGLGSEFVLLVPRGPLARLHTIAARPANPQQPYSFQGACRAHLAGPLTALTKATADRVVDLHFGPRRRLHLRLTGRSGGLWLIEDERVLAAFDGPAPPELPALPSAAGPRPSPAQYEPGTSDLEVRGYYTALEQRQRLELRRAAVERALRRHLAKQARLAEGLRADLDKAAEAPRWRRMADALAANLHHVRRGATRVELADLEDPSITHDVALEPNRPASFTLDRLYGKARRLDRMADRVLLHLDRVEGEIARLAAALGDVAGADEDALSALERQLPRLPEARPRTTELPWHVWTGPRGERVLVGRNEKGNRRLTFQAARGADFWMHVRGRPGAHLVIPMQGEQSPSLELLLAAAQIALAHAKLVEGGTADVQYTRVRNVRAIPGEVGRVTLHDEKVLHVARDPAALRDWVRE